MEACPWEVECRWAAVQGWEVGSVAECPWEAEVALADSAVVAGSAEVDSVEAALEALAEAVVEVEVGTAETHRYQRIALTVLRVYR